MVLRTLLALALCSVAAAQDLSEIENRLAALELDAGTSVVRESPAPAPGRFYGDVQFMFMRAETGHHLDDQYKLAPRAVLGFEQGAGLRVRYWQYDYLLPSNGFSVNQDGNYIYHIPAQRIDIEAFDFELTGRFQGRHTDALISGGLRWASLDLDVARQYYVDPYSMTFFVDDIGPLAYMDDTRAIGIDLFGPTFAVDGRTRIWRGLAGVYGGRISVMGGNWSGNPLWSSNPGRDTYFVPEIYAGLEYSYGPMVARVVYEYQQWQSDAFDDISTISFDGIGAHLGVSY